MILRIRVAILLGIVTLVCTPITIAFANKLPPVATYKVPEDLDVFMCMYVWEQPLCETRSSQSKTSWKKTDTAEGFRTLGTNRTNGFWGYIEDNKAYALVPAFVAVLALLVTTIVSFGNFLTRRAETYDAKEALISELEVSVQFLNQVFDHVKNLKDKKFEEHLSAEISVFKKTLPKALSTHVYTSLNATHLRKTRILKSIISIYTNIMVFIAFCENNQSEKEYFEASEPTHQKKVSMSIILMTYLLGGFLNAENRNAHSGNARSGENSQSKTPFVDGDVKNDDVKLFVFWVLILIIQIEAVLDLLQEGWFMSFYRKLFRAKHSITVINIEYFQSYWGTAEDKVNEIPDGNYFRVMLQNIFEKVIFFLHLEGKDWVDFESYRENEFSIISHSELLSALRHIKSSSKRKKYNKNYAWIAKSF